MSNLQNKLKNIDSKLNQKIAELLIWASNRSCDWNKFDAVLKGDEEFGELSEAVLVSTGRIKHKTLNEKSTGEIADNINQLIDVISYNKKLVKEVDYLIQNQSSFYFHLKYSFDDFKDVDFKALAIQKLINYKNFKDFLVQAEEEEEIFDDIIRFEYCTKYLAEINFILYLVENDIKKEEVNDETMLTSLIELFDKLEAKSNKWKRINSNL